MEARSTPSSNSAVLFPSVELLGCVRAGFILEVSDENLPVGVMSDGLPFVDAPEGAFSSLIVASSSFWSKMASSELSAVDFNVN